MPELPEVEAARRAIEDHCIGRKIVKSIVADDAKVIDGVSASEFEASLLGKTIVAAHRKGKNMWLQLDSPPFPSFQFGMAGAIYIKGVAVTKYKRSAVNDTDEWPSKYSKVFIALDDGLELSFTDKRRFAKVRLLKDPASVPPISELGSDALLEPMTVDELHNSLSKKKIGIKALLLDQGFLSGIGNWIADEVLYQARIHPMQIASTISKESSTALHRSIKEVIQFAVQVDADAGRFPLDWLFHYRWGKKPGKVNGKKIDFINAGGRTTAYVPEVQKLSGAQASKDPAKIIKPASRKKKPVHGGNTDDDDGLEGGEDSVEKVKSKRVKTTNNDGGKKNQAKQEKLESSDDNEAEYKSRNQRVKAAPKRKTKGSSNGGENEDNENANQKKPRVDSKKASAKTKSKGNAGSEIADDNGSDDKEDQKKLSKVTKRKPAKIPR
ncbi:Formamidopyrimidine-DNA glycosylase [Dionaea muscipula]